MRSLLISVCVVATAMGCTQKQESVQAAAPPAAAPKLGIRPGGDTEIKVDVSKVTSEELKKVYSYRDEHIDGDGAGLLKGIRALSMTKRGECNSGAATLWNRVVE